ncbi:MAG: cupin domain-containing protein [Elusimicrobia bacterium]|nr:cupin domain-containing protein [Elusimicrobiota bacterium]
MSAAAKQLIRALRLRPHPEGGFFRETYRAARSRDGRSASTAILFLLPRGCVSRLHRIKSDELWHFYSGGPLVVVELTKSGVRRTRLGAGRFQHVVGAGTWFGAELARGADCALVGCTVAPGFEFRDLEMGRRDDLLRMFPRSRRVIGRLIPA